MAVVSAVNYQKSVVWTLKQIIREILDGNFKYDNGSLDFSCPRIDLSVQAGKVEEGSFTVYGPEGVLTEGYVVSSDLRMECLTPSFGGSRDEISYRIDASEMKAGDEIKGAFHMISNQGEYQLPFSVTITPVVIESSLGRIKNLFHFTNLAKSNWPEAVKLFYSEKFEQVFTGNEQKYYTAYKGLSMIRGNEHNVEEFLLEINKKTPVEFIPEETRIRLEDPTALSRYALVINRNGWGYTHLQIETEGDFLSVNETVVSDDAFLGNLYRLYYYIQDDKLHAGNNYGCIRLISYEKEIRIPVTVVYHVKSGRKRMGSYQEKKRVTMQMMQYYQAFRLKKISTKTWMEETGKLIERLKEIDGNDLAIGLFQAQILITKERIYEAKWILEQNKDTIEKMREDIPELWCYYLYLTTLCSKNDDYVDEITGVISRVYERNRGNWRIAWLLFFLSDEYVRLPARKWTLLEELFTYGCKSPIIYIEAWNLLCMNPATLLKLGEFELQILNYAAKNEAMKDDVLIQLLYLAQKQKNYSELLFRILAACYRKKPQNDTLHAICATLIKGNKYGSKYFKWYQAGVDQNLRITRLYEYYMMSVSLDDRETLPKMVLMYFSYHSELSYEITAFLYAYVLKHQEEMPDIYAAYLPAVERFVTEQIKRGRINKNLAYLYRNVLMQPMVDEETAQNLMNLLFMQDITVENDAVKQVFVVYPYGTRQMSYPVTDGRTQAPVYDEECRLIMEDAEQNRYMHSISYQAEPLITTGKLFTMASSFIKDHLGYALYVCYDRKSDLIIQEDNVGWFKYLADSDFLMEKKRQEIRIKLVGFFYEKDRMWELDEYLLSLKPEEIAVDDRKEIVRIMALRGLYPEAWEWVRNIGPYKIDAKTLLKLCSRLLGQSEPEEDELMTGILCYVLKKGKYDEQILKYLVRFFNGDIKEMWNIWNTAADFGVDTYELSERIIVQLLYAGSHLAEKTDVFRSYIKDSGKEEVITAFLSQCCYDYVIKEKIIEPFFIQSVLQMYREKADLHLVCKIAFLKYYAENREEITEAVAAVIREFLQEMLKRHIVLPLFKEYQGYLPALDILQDRSILEYRTKPGNRVMVHYLIQKEEEAEQEYRRENMKDMFGGICVKDFVLFFGEKLQYYITENADGKDQVTQSGTITGSDANGTVHENSKFNMLNDIVISRALQDYDTVDELLEEYYKKDFMTDKLFTAL